MAPPSTFDLNLPRRHLADPIDAFQMDREINREIKDTLGRFPIIGGQVDPEGNVAAVVGAIYLRVGNNIGRLYLKVLNDRQSTGWSEISGDFTFQTTGAITLPKGTTAQRPSNPVAGMFRFNEDTDLTEFYDGTTWV